MSLMCFIGSVASTKFKRFQLIKPKCYKINLIENQHFSYLSDSIFHKEKQKTDRCDRTLFGYGAKNMEYSWFLFSQANLHKMVISKDSIGLLKVKF